MAHHLLDLHQLAAQAQILQTQYMAGILTDEEYKDKIQHLHAHNDIQPTSEHEASCAEYREIIDGALRLVEIR